MNKNLITTALELPGYRIIESLGIAHGISVRSPTIGGGFRIWFQNLGGGEIRGYKSLCEKTRSVAIDRLIEHAKSLGAHALIGMRFDSNELAAGTTEVLAYGTAVTVEKV
jgi:uncharacterized protein YbjQ (UPF0145 family)